VTASLSESLPEMGREVAIDSSDLPAYANGQRYLSKNGPERERFSDPTAAWGHRSAVSTRKGEGFYGYKLHAAVCALTGLPLAWRVESADHGDALFALPLVTRFGIAASRRRRARWTRATTPARSTTTARNATPARSSLSPVVAGAQSSAGRSARGVDQSLKYPSSGDEEAKEPLATPSEAWARHAR
jgi:Transposase DDE domain